MRCRLYVRNGGLDIHRIAVFCVFKIFVDNATFCLYFQAM